jgi:hypothetical protein
VRSTRTYAWAPHRSQMSNAVSGLVGAIAPFNVAFLSRRASGLYIRLAPVFCPYSSAQHIPRRERSPLRVVYATSETAPRLSVVTSITTTTLLSLRPHSARVLPVLESKTGSTQAPCVSYLTDTPMRADDAFVMISLGFHPAAAWHAAGSRPGTLPFD